MPEEKPGFVKKGKYVQKLIALYPDEGERFDLLKETVEELIGCKLKYAEFIVALMVCTEKYLLNPTLILSIDRRNQHMKSVISASRSRTVRELIAEYICKRNESPHKVSTNDEANDQTS